MLYNAGNGNNRTVALKATGVCVKWGGSAGGANYQSPFEHCD